jgi:hypothetical protein
MVPEQSNVHPPRRRRRFQFSLRTLLVVIAVCGLFIGNHMERVRKRDQSAQVIHAVGGTIQYDDQHVPTNTFVPTGTKPHPEWQKKLLGTSVVMVTLRDTNVTNEDLCCLENMPELICLNLDNTAITDESVETLVRLTNLKSLDARWTYLSDRAVLRIMKALPDCGVTFTFRRGLSWHDPSNDRPREPIPANPYVKIGLRPLMLNQAGSESPSR